MRPSQRGFTLIEIVVVLIVGTILTSIAMNAMGSVQGRYAVKQARSTFASLQARARAQAIETGQTTRLWVDLTGDSVWIVRGGTRIEMVNFGKDYGVDITGDMSQLRVCMNARGFADESCNNFTSTEVLTFASRSGDTASVSVRTLGQLSY